MDRAWLARFLVGVSILVGVSACSLPVTRDPHHYRVEVGDTLYSIAWSYGLDWQQLAHWNRIGPPYPIFPGQQLSIVPGEVKVVTTSTGSGGPPVVTIPVGGATSVATTAKPVAALPTRAHRHPSRPHRAEPARQPVHSIERASAVPNHPSPGTTRWRWPTAGRVVAGFEPAQGKKGLDIAGHFGQQVEAAAAGDVVYSGKGLIGYGNLVIIKHNDVWLSAYGYNSRLLVKEGDHVKSGQIIAKMGENGNSGSILHFEIRKNGNPVDPTRYLPVRK